MDIELLRFNRVDLVQYAVEVHGYEIDRSCTNRALAVLRAPDGDAVVVAVDAEGIYHFSSIASAADHGTIMQFAQRRLGPGTSADLIRHELRHWLSDKSREITRKELPHLEKSSRELAALTARWLGMQPYTGTRLQQLGFTEATIEPFAGAIRTDEHGSACFRHRNTQGVTGWEVVDETRVGFAEGGTRSLLGVLVGGPEVSELILADSALDLLAFFQTAGRPGLYLSFGGSLNESQRELVTGVLRSHPAVPVSVATAADVRGVGFAAWIASVRPDAARRLPEGGLNRWLEVVVRTRRAVAGGS